MNKVKELSFLVGGAGAKPLRQKPLEIPKSPFFIWYGESELRSLLPQSKLLRATLCVTGGIALIIALDLVPILRGGEIFNWLWPYTPLAVHRLAIFSASVMLYLLIALILISRAHHRAGVVWAAIGVVLLSLMATWARTGHPIAELYDRSLSLTATGPYATSALIDWSQGQWLDWTTIMVDYRDVSRHVALSPPLLPLLNHTVTLGIDAVPALDVNLQRLVLPYQCHNYTYLSFTAAEQATVIFGILMPVWAALAVFPLYGLQRHFIRQAAPYVPILWALVPSLVMYGASYNTLYPTFGLLSFWWLVLGIDARLGIGWLIASGVMMGLLVFANLSIVPLALFFGFYTLLHYGIHQYPQRPLYRPVLVGLWFGLGVLIVWGGFMLIGGSSPWAILQVAFDSHLALDRPYVPWLWMHFWEWALLGSVPLVTLWLGSLVVARRPLNALALALAVTMLVLLLSNTARGETGRVWLFFTPVVMLAIARPDYTLRDWRALYAAQAVMLIVLVGTWNVMEAPDVQAPPPTPPPAPALNSIDVPFDAGFTLVGWGGQVVDGAIDLSLAWRGDQFVTTPYYFAAIAVAPDGTLSDSVVWQPQATTYPTTCWYGQRVGDRITIPLPADAPATGWYVSLSAFADVDAPLMRVPLVLPDGTRDQQIGIGPIDAP